MEFAALSYLAPKMNRYRYRLEGLETQWNEVDSWRRSATYTNLSAAKYLFRVQGSNNDGLWNSQGATLAITVLPPWWATWWFISVAALAMAGLIFAMYRSRVKRFKLQTARLETQVAQRTHELEFAKNAAEEANRAKTIFLASMSHELRTPLNAILGFSHLLGDTRLSEKQRRDLEVINGSGEHLLNLINDVLDMAKIDAGRIVIENAPVDLRDLISGVADLMRFRSNEKGLELSVLETAESCQFIETDGEKLRQILINLVGNAVKYTDRGSIILRVSDRPGSDAQRCTLVIEVQDTGIGIAEAEQARIFEPFIQAGKLSAQKGTGLGLAITKKFVELMGGNIRVESELGEGSSFRVELPVLKLEQVELPSETPRGRVTGLEPGQPQYRVLIVEDQRENWRLLQGYLQNAGFQVQVAEDAVTGINKFVAWRPHFIWMDWRLPGMDGLEASRCIRELDGGRDVKIAMLSAYAFGEDVEKAMAAGVDDFVSKPFRADEVFNCLARHLGVRYTYETAVTQTAPGPLSPEAFASLPLELRKELAGAIISLDIDRIAAIITRIAEQNEELGRVLSQHAEQFAYPPILDALQSSEMCCK